MKQFNLAEYLKNPERKIVTRDGRKVKRILCVDAKGDHPIVALIKSKDEKEEYPLSYTVNGRYSLDYEKSVDLFFVPEKYEKWTPIYSNIGTGIRSIGRLYSTKEEAEEIGKRSIAYLTAAKVEWEE